MAEALRRYLPGTTFEMPQGGYFFWGRFPDGLDASAVLAEAHADRVDFRPGVRFSSQGSLQDRFRLSFAFYETEMLVEGIRRLGKAVARVQRS